MSVKKEAVISTDLRLCSVCNTNKPQNEFYKFGKKCKTCVRKREQYIKKSNKEYRLKHANKLRIEQMKIEEQKEKQREIQKAKDEISYKIFIKNIYRINKNPKNKSCNKNVCPYCGKKKANSSHHIIPRKYGGWDDKQNLICLCSLCHDEIEEKTEEWISSGKIFSLDILRSMIINMEF